MKARKTFSTTVRQVHRHLLAAVLGAASGAACMGSTSSTAPAAGGEDGQAARGGSAASTSGATSPGGGASATAGSGSSSGSVHAAGEPNSLPTFSDVDPGPGTDTDKATVRCAAIAAATPAGAAVPVQGAGKAMQPGAAAPSPGLGSVQRAAAAASSWLSTRGNRIYNSDGSLFHGRGVNLPDPRGCGACACNVITLADSTQEVMRRIDTLVASWNVNFLRLALESYAVVDTSVVTDPAYLAAIQQIVAHIESKPGLYVEVSVWFDPSLDANGWPTAATDGILTTLVNAIGQSPRVLFGICNEPQSNSDGALDAQVWARMNTAAVAIRAAEKALGVPQHIILAQGTGGWARYLAYYQTHPLTAGDGTNFAYEVHVYDAASTFQDRFVTPSQTIPVVISEFGPLDGSMTLADTAALMVQAEAAGVPYLAWTFHGRCVPSLLVDTSGGGCGIGMTLTPSPWGQQLQAQLAKPW